MVDQALEYKSLLNKVDIMINNVKTLGMDTTRYEETLKKIINEVESSTKVSKTKWGNNASMVLICDYAKGIKELRALELELSEYEVYFKTINSCEYLLMRMDKMNNTNNKEEVKSYANEIIKSLEAIKFSNTIHYSDEKRIVEKIYDVAYKIIELEIITFGSSQVYEYVKNYDIDTYFLDRCIRREIESLNLNDEKNKKIKEKIYEISRSGLDTNYFDIELIKLLICNSNDIDLKDNIIKELNSLKREINSIVVSYNRTLSSSKYSLNEYKRLSNEVKKERKKIFGRIVSSVVSLSIIVGGAFGIHHFVKKGCTKPAYPKTTTTYSDEYGKDTKYSYSFVEDKEQEKTYIRVYSDWHKKFLSGTVMNIDTYDVSKTELSNIEDYLELNYEGLDFDRDTVTLGNDDDLAKKGYVEVEQILINRDKTDPVLDKDIYIFLILMIYTMYIAIISAIECFLYKKDKSSRIVGITYNLYQLLKNDIKNYKENKSYCKKQSQIYKKNLNSLLEEMNKYEELRTRFDELYNQNKYLLDNPEELLSKIDSLSQELNKEEIKGKLKSLKRY